ncbi:YusW family protein [Alkalihalophilus marmarensis]|uniref:YusW family protein n=1 Tax=Alkalihalophilus marmarensis TaxID=521377 RepID=UPI002DBC0D6B|nr:YusW family protein [Alkalihalophilus marmarensis]MEC2071866.1 YusW family protein [Alkalihalophilus marmarensis]
MKKAKTILAGAFITSTIVLGACNTDQEVDNPAPEDQVEEEDNTMGDDTDDTIGDDDTTMEDDDTTMGDDTDTDEDNDMGEDMGDMTEDEEPATTAFGFSTFELSVNYDEMGDNYDVTYEHDPEEVRAEIDDSVNDTQLEGDEAYTELETTFEEMELDSSMSEEEIIDAVVQGFGLDPNYDSLELTITWDDGTDLDIEHSQEDDTM